MNDPKTVLERAIDALMLLSAFLYVWPNWFHQKAIVTGDILPVLGVLALLWWIAKIFKTRIIT